MEKLFSFIKKTIKYTFVLMLAFVVYSFTLMPIGQWAYVHLIVYLHHNEMQEAAERYRQAIYDCEDKNKIKNQDNEWYAYNIMPNDSYEIETTSQNVF